MLSSFTAKGNSYSDRRRTEQERHYGPPSKRGSSSGNGLFSVSFATFLESWTSYLVEYGKSVTTCVPLACGGRGPQWSDILDPSRSSTTRNGKRRRSHHSFSNKNPDPLDMCFDSNKSNPRDCVRCLSGQTMDSYPLMTYVG